MDVLLKYLMCIDNLQKLNQKVVITNYLVIHSDLGDICNFARWPLPGNISENTPVFFIAKLFSISLIKKLPYLITRINNTIFFVKPIPVIA